MPMSSPLEAPSTETSAEKVPLEELLLWPPVAAVAVGEIWVRVPEISPSVASLVMRAFMPMDTLGTSYS